MPNEKITSLDVARLAGVSQSAVSRYFTPGTSVSKKTAEKVKAASDQLGYRPNILARSLITGKSRIIGLVVAYLENYFYPEVVERLSAALQEEGYHVLVFIAAMGSDQVDRIAGRFWITRSTASSLLRYPCLRTLPRAARRPAYRSCSSTAARTIRACLR